MASAVAVAWVWVLGVGVVSVRGCVGRVVRPVGGCFPAVPRGPLGPRRDRRPDPRSRPARLVALPRSRARPGPVRPPHPADHGGRVPGGGRTPRSISATRPVERELPHHLHGGRHLGGTDPVAVVRARAGRGPAGARGGTVVGSRGARRDGTSWQWQSLVHNCTFCSACC